MQRFTIYFCKTLYMFQTRLSVHHQELKTAHTASGICQTNTATFCLPGHRPSSGVQNCTYSVWYLSDQYCYLLLAWPPSIIRSSKLHIQRLVFVRPILLPSACLARLAAGSSIGLYCIGWLSRMQEHMLLHTSHPIQYRQIPDALCAVLSSWWWTEKRSETCRAS